MEGIMSLIIPLAWHSKTSIWCMYLEYGFDSFKKAEIPLGGWAALRNRECSVDQIMESGSQNF